MTELQPEKDRTLLALHYAFVVLRKLAEVDGDLVKIARVADMLELVPLSLPNRSDAERQRLETFQALCDIDPLFEMALRAYRGDEPEIFLR